MSTPLPGLKKVSNKSTLFWLNGKNPLPSIVTGIRPVIGPEFGVIEYICKNYFGLGRKTLFVLSNWVFPHKEAENKRSKNTIGPITITIGIK